jgi:hypothetical protein
MIEVRTGQPKWRYGIHRQHLNGLTLAVGAVVVLIVVGAVIFNSNPTASAVNLPDRSCNLD